MDVSLESYLKQVFGYSTFRPNQKEIVEHVLNRRDVFAVMPTGGGKSLCYQLPAIVSEGTAIVISPLISLMKDQVDGARGLGIRAEYLNSNLSPMEMSDIYRMLRNDGLDLLYVSPERFAMENFLQSLEEIKVSLFAVDEAHCMSEWGHDFRPDYMNLKILKERFPSVPVAAFTATATERVQRDITERLRLDKPFTVRASFNRPNLYYRIEPKTDIKYQLLNFVREHPDDPGIIYRTSRKNVESTAAFLKENGIRALPYHAGLDRDEREKNQNAFNCDEIQVIVATIAFGMGIDKSNVRFVVHGDLPKNIEGYYQETGRAGRDDDPSVCVLFFGRGDIARIRYFIDQMTDDQEHKIALGKLNRMADFASVNLCRRKQLLEYFGEKYSIDNCGGCDICVDDMVPSDETIPAQKMMSAIARTKEEFGRDHVISIVTGDSTEAVVEHEHDQLPTFGIGKDKEKSWWHVVLDELLVRKCIVKNGETLNLTPKGRNILFGRDKFMALRKAPTTGRKSKVKVPAMQTADYDQELFERLRNLRREIASQMGVPPYVVFTDKTLHDMARIVPQRRSEMLQVSGVGNAKLRQYGTRFIEEIRMYLEDYPDRVPSGKKSVMSSTKKSAPAQDKQVRKLAEKGFSVEDICNELKLTPSKAVKCLEKLLKNGADLNIDNLVEPYVRIEIERQLETHGSDISNTALARLFMGSISVDEIRLVRAAL